MRRQLSKSRLLSFLQCPRKLWLDVHRPWLAAMEEQRRAQFESGHEVGAIAQLLYASRAAAAADTLAPAPGQASAEVTGQLLLPFAGAAGVEVLFEPQFIHDNVLVRADVLERSATRTRLIEVKASSSLKAHHLPDCAIQAWVMEGAGTTPTSVAVAHIDDQFLYAGDGNYRGLLTEADVTSQVASMTHQVPLWSRGAQEVLGGDEPPIPVGQRCFSPHDCPFIAHCWPQTEYPLTSLPRLGKRLDQYVARGYRDVRDIPEDEIVGAEATRVWRATRMNCVELGAALGEELRAIAFPRYYLDFETIAPVVPLWAGTRPRQAIPYQWSVHLESAAGVVEHMEYLDLTGDLPARGVADSLVRALGTDGPIVTYSDYERQCLEMLAELVPDFAPRLQALADRLVDLLPLLKRNYYHPAMRGSWSIKRVLPTVVPGMRYDLLGEIREGQGAGRAYIEAISAATTQVRREEIRLALLAYCRLDTEAMLRLAQTLSGAGTGPVVMR